MTSAALRQRGTWRCRDCGTSAVIESLSGDTVDRLVEFMNAGHSPCPNPSQETER